jgi:uncharacterized protein YkwD
MHVNGRIFRIVACAAACTAIATLHAQDETHLINKINAARGVARTCPGGKTFATAPKLTVNSSMANGAKAVAVDLLPDNTMRRLAENNYLAFGANMLFDGEVGVFEFPSYDQLVPFWLKNQRSCEVLMNPGFTEAKMSLHERPGWATRLAVVLATPYNPANAADYKRRIFEELNKIRATGVSPTTYPGAQCSSSGPVPTLQWNDKMAEAAQFHSNDYATAGVINRDPHIGTKGDTASSRIQAAGCTQGGGENVNLNFGLTPEAAVRNWLTLSAGHCQNVVLVSGAKVAGIGIAHSAALQKLPTGPFVTFNLGDDKGCQAATKTSPSGNVPSGGDNSVGDRIRAPAVF